MLTKLPPPPPKLGQHIVVQPKPSVIKSVNTSTFNYGLPMFDTYTPAWVEVLRRAGYPTQVLVIDFETFFSADYSMGRKADDLSTIEYVTDKRFEVVSCTFTTMTAEYPFADYSQHTTFHATEEAVEAHIRYLQGRFGQNFESVVVVAQNAVFDCTVLARQYGIHPKYLIDILGIGRHLNSRQKNDLATLCEQYELPPKGDTSQFEGLTFRTRLRKPPKKGPQLPLPMPKFTDAQVAALAVYNVNDNLREWELFTMTLPLISNPVTELRIMQLTIEMFTRPMLEVDFAKGEELAGLYEQEIDRVVGAVTVPNLFTDQTDARPATREDISGNKTFEALMIQAIEAAGENALAYTKFGKKGAMLALAKADDEREALLNHPDPTIKGLMEARVAIKSWPLHIARVKRIMEQAKAAGGKLCVPLKYHGAHTGRDAGGEKINLQNMGSRGHALITAIRNMLIAPDGHTLVIVDAAQVEARGTDWIAGQEDSVTRWANNDDQYSIFATDVLGFHVRKPSGFEKKNLPDYAKKLGKGRDFGKVGVLGCGFGMGWEKAIGFAKTAYNVDLDEPTSKKLIDHYRTSHAQVVQFWRDVERAFAYTARYHRPCVLPRGLRFDPYNDVGVIITLPNGRELHYPRVKLVPGRFKDSNDGIEVYNAILHSWEYTWGGSLVENIVQAFCRDILMEAMLRLDDQGHRTVHRIHDELILCVPDAIAPDVLKTAEAEMAKTPVWAPGLPLGAEGKLSKMYCK